MTFSEEYIAACIENAGKFGEWEPGLGHYCTPKESSEPAHGLPFLIASKSRRFYRLYSAEGNQRWSLLAKHLKQDFIPLFTLRQLITMLEERGLKVIFASNPDEGGYFCKAYELTAEVERHFHAEGPDPETAVSKCLLKVIEKED